MMGKILRFAVLILLLPVAGLAADEVRIPCSKDVWVSAYGSPGMGGNPPEYNFSMGKTSKLKFKTIQEQSLFYFDCSGLKGKKTAGATLYLREISPTNLRWMGVSTVASPWVEGTATEDYTTDEAGHGATFREASYKQHNWSYPGSDLSDVTFTNGHTLDHHTELERRGGWLLIDEPDYIVSALISGDSHGIAVMDDGVPNLGNSFVHSRESGPQNAPYLVVEVQGKDSRPPKSPASLRVTPLPHRATMDTGAVLLTFVTPEDAFCYFIEVNGEPLERWRTPHPSTPGSTERIVVDYLAPEQTVQVSLVVCDSAGNRSEPLTASGTVSAARGKPADLPSVNLVDAKQPGTPPKKGEVRVWAVPELVEANPLDGTLIHEKDAQYQARNAVWSAGIREVSIKAMKGEIVGFQLMVEALAGRASDIGIKPTVLTSGKASIPVSSIELFREWYVNCGGTWQPEYAVPLKQGGTFDIPWAENGVPGQKVQGVYVDVYVPFDAPAGRYEGTLRIFSGGGNPLDIRLSLEVMPLSMPRQMTFFPELNTYGIRGGEGGELWFQMHRLAHQHRSVLNVLPYSQNGSVHGHIPRVTGSGTAARVSDWSTFDSAVGPICDGSAFRGLHRDGVPVPVYYLPFHENYPMPVDMINYNGRKHGKGVRMEFFLNAPPMKQLFPDAYWEGISAITSQYARHIQEKGWLDTEFQCYLNNKPNYREEGRGSAWWILDEPYHYKDWEMLAEYGRHYLKGLDGLANEPDKPVMTYRCDISRPRWTRMWLKGIMDVVYVGGAFFDRWKRVNIMIREYPLSARAYGSCNVVDRSSVETQAWCVKSFLYGGDGVLPWQTLGGAGALTTPTQTGIMLDTRDRFGTPVASIRLKALRRGQQDVEYLRLLMNRTGYNHEQIRTLSLKHLNLGSEFEQSFMDEAAAISFGSLRERDFMTLTAAAGEVLRRMGPGAEIARGNTGSPNTGIHTVPAVPDVEVNGPEAYEHLLSEVVEAAGERRLGRVMVEVMGMPMRVRVESADEDKLTVAAAAGLVPVRWSDVRPIHFYGIAARAIDKEDASSRLILARYCIWKGLGEKALQELEAALEDPETSDQASALKTVIAR